jgi:hypothetical protein
MSGEALEVCELQWYLPAGSDVGSGHRTGAQMSRAQENGKLHQSSGNDTWLFPRASSCLFSSFLMEDGRVCGEFVVLRAEHGGVVGS